MPKVSAGIMMCRRNRGELEILLVHPGGPFWKKKDVGAWTFPRGEVIAGEQPLAAAVREFNEETSINPSGPFRPLGEVRHKSGKVVHAWAFQGDCDPDAIRSNTFTMEWPPHSGKTQEFPEVDRASFFDVTTAREKILPSEEPLIDRLIALFPTATDAHRIGRRDRTLFDVA